MKLEKNKVDLDNSRNMSGITSLENSNIPLVKVNNIADDLDNLEIKHFGGDYKIRPMTANTVTSKLNILNNLFSRKKAHFQRSSTSIRESKPWFKS